MVKYISFVTDKEYNQTDRYQPYGAPSPYFRRVFNISKSVKRVTLRASAYGIYTFKVNGVRCDSEVFAPGWSDYHYTVYYRAYDITQYINVGKNALGVTMGDGWYASHLSDVGRFVFGEYPLKFWYEISVAYLDGTTERIVIDGSEKASVGSIVASDNQNGQITDLRLDLGEFSLPEYDDSKWHKATICEGLKPRKASFEPIRPHQPLVAKLISSVEKEGLVTEIYDCCQNFGGVIKARLTGGSGDKIAFRYSEILLDDKIYTDNLRSAKATDTLYLAGNDEEEFYPEFTYHGFRFVEIVHPKTVSVYDVQGIPFYTDLTITSEFSCSDSVVEKLYNNILWGQKSNFMSIPTDCPQRDERLGWTGDAQLFCDTALYNMNCNEFFCKFMHDAQDSMTDGKGDIPVVLPYLFDYVTYDKLHINYTGYSESVITIPYRLYKVYGNRTILAECLPLMKKHMDYMLKVSDGYIPVDSNSHGDWLSVYETTDKTVFSTLYFAYSADLMTKICSILGDRDEGYYLKMLLNIKRAFKENFVDENGVIKSDTQCVYILAYMFGVMSADQVRPHLKRKFEQYDNHLVAGFHGAKYALQTLCDVGLKDVAYQVLTNKDLPSWGYSVVSGGTTIWERWDGFTKDGAHVNKMNSYNHFVFGSTGYWFFEYMLGFKNSEFGIGYNKIKISPYFDKRIQSAKGSYDSVSGKISAKFEYDNDKIKYTISFNKNVVPEFSFNNVVLSNTKTEMGDMVNYEFILED